MHLNGSNLTGLARREAREREAKCLGLRACNPCFSTWSRVGDSSAVVPCHLGTTAKTCDRHVSEGQHNVATMRVSDGDQRQGGRGSGKGGAYSSPSGPLNARRMVIGPVTSINLAEPPCACRNGASCSARQYRAGTISFHRRPVVVVRYIVIISTWPARSRHWRGGGYLVVGRRARMTRWDHRGNQNATRRNRRGWTVGHGPSFSFVHRSSVTSHRCGTSNVSLLIHDWRGRWVSDWGYPHGIGIADVTARTNCVP